MKMALEPTYANWVRGLHSRNSECLDGIFISTALLKALLKDAIDAANAAPSMRRRVAKTREV